MANDKLTRLQDALKRLRGTLYGQLLLWAAVAGYVAFVGLHEPTFAAARIGVAVASALVPYAVALAGWTAPWSPPSVHTSKDLKKKVGIEPGTAAAQIRSDLERLSADLELVQQAFRRFRVGVGEMVGTIAEETQPLCAVIDDTAARVREDTDSLRTSLQETVRLIQSIPSIGSMYQLHPAPPADPKLAAEAEPYVQALLANDDYRKRILNLANNAALVDVIESLLRSLWQRSSDLCTWSALYRRTVSSPRIQDWIKTNKAALESLDAVAPLLRRLRRLADLDDSRSSIAEFLSGLTEPETRAFGLLLESKREGLRSEQQVLSSLQRTYEGLARQWLTPVVGLYQLIHEALRVEDAEVYERTVASFAPRGAADLQNPRGAVQAAAAVLGFRYVHFELYLADPLKMPADRSPNAPRFTFAQWIEGELGDDRWPVPQKGSLVRVLKPRFEDCNNKALEPTEIVIIKGER